jgi:primosomal protein N'
MARFRCSACGQEGDFTYDPTRHECPRCGSNHVVFALGIEEMPDELFEALMQAEPLDDHPTDEDR